MNKLYETDSYLKECDITITAAISKEGLNLVEFDQSIFFPEEGGQYADTGMLRIISLPEGYNGELSVGDEISLTDGQINGERICYTVDKLIPVNSKVRGILDWNTRFDRMQNHSGEHVLTGVIHNKYGFNNVGFHLSDDGFVTLDLDGMLSYEQVIEMEKVANGVVYDDVAITDSYPSKDELKTIDYRSKIEIEGQTRLITIGNETIIIDVCACCAPHVKSTGSIGIIKVISVIKFKKGIQISILCGRRALEYINNEHSIMTSLSRGLSTSPEKVEGVVKSYAAEISELKSRLSSVMEGKIIDEIKSMDATEVGCIFTEDDLSAVNMKNIYNALVEHFEGYVGVFVGNDETGYRYNAGGKNLDARELAKMMRESLGAKGGGSAEMIQGRVEATKENIIKIMN